MLFSVWETCVQDYEIVVKETTREWPKPDIQQGPTHPAVNVSWDNAAAFATWLTTRERAAGKIADGEVYRLPSDHEWSCAVGIGAREDATMSIDQKVANLVDDYPWGTAWPPPAGAGNFAGMEIEPLLTKTEYASIKAPISGYRDEFPTTAPVGSFAANEFGLYDLSGNAWEFCEEIADAGKMTRVAGHGRIPSRDICTPHGGRRRRRDCA